MTMVEVAPVQPPHEELCTKPARKKRKKAMSREYDLDLCMLVGGLSAFEP